VAVARAFVNRPLILLADEPTGNLDPQTSQGIMQLLDRINRTGTTVVIATHDEVLVDKMRRRVIELSNGILVRDQARGVYGIDGTTSLPRSRRWAECRSRLTTSPARRRRTCGATA
jgi:cell division transport system ATP-binding protein